jgi:hypothetical protein
MPEVIDNLRRYRERIAAAPEPPVAGGRTGGSTGGPGDEHGAAAEAAAVGAPVADGEAGSGGDD